MARKKLSRKTRDGIQDDAARLIESARAGPKELRRELSRRPAIEKLGPEEQKGLIKGLVALRDLQRSGLLKTERVRPHVRVIRIATPREATATRASIEFTKEAFDIKEAKPELLRIGKDKYAVPTRAGILVSEPAKPVVRGSTTLAVLPGNRLTDEDIQRLKRLRRKEP